MKRQCPVLVAAKANPEAPALLFAGSAWTWAQAHQAVSATAAALQRNGVASGDRVAICSWNKPEVIWLFWAAARCGASLVPLNARLTWAELGPLLERVRPKVVLGELPGSTSLEVGSCGGDGDESAACDDDAVVAGLFTSGTTGVPKLVELTHGNFRAASEANALRLGGESAQRWLGLLPLFHVGGLAMMYRCAVYGATLVLESQFDVASACAALDEGVTHVSLVPTMLERVLQHRGSRPFGGVKAALIGGGPMTGQMLERARAVGLPVLQTYGLTEACSQVTTELLAEADGTSAGVPLPGVQLRICEPDAQGVGEIEVLGPTVAKGLGPWLKTKDLGAIDARGRLTVMARRVDLILTGGENVYPAEVEAVLSAHPSIRDIAVVGRADAQWGQVPVAVVVAPEFDRAEVNAWARERLAAFKVPRAWIQVDGLPRNATGKIDRARVSMLAATP